MGDMADWTIDQGIASDFEEPWLAEEQEALEAETMNEPNDFDDDEGYVTEAQVRRFRRIARSMDKLLREIRADSCPKANLYLEDSGNWNLMTGDSHDWIDGRSTQRRDRVVETVRVDHSSGGGW